MGSWLIKKFIKDYENTEDLAVRAAYGKLSGLIGIFCNMLLFLGKFLVGTFSGSVSITADAVNNLSDAASSIISLVGFRLAERPADADHPYGHARYEYLSGLTVAVLILLIGFELLKNSLDKVLHPAVVEFQAMTAIVLIGSILVKLWMAALNYRMGKSIHSSTLEATAADSRNDVISTTAVLIAALLSHFFHVDLDGYMGIAVAAFILFSGVGLIKESLDPLLVKDPDPELVAQFEKKILSYPGVLGIHDLLIHDYGPGRLFASVHVEMSAEEDVLKSHDIIDTIEWDIERENHMLLTIHYDPVITTDEHLKELRQWLSQQIKTIHPDLTIHDFRIVPGESHTNLIFDCVKPYNVKISDDELKTAIQNLVWKTYPDYYTVVRIDASYVPLPHDVPAKG